MALQPATPTVALAAACIAILALAGCAPGEPGDTAPPSPTESTTAPTEPSPTPDPTASATPTPSQSPPPIDADWQGYALGDGHTSWSMPPGWQADIDRAGETGLIDYEGLLLDGDGTPMLRFQAVAGGGQYASDGQPCERPETEVLEVEPLGDAAGANAAVVALTYLEGQRWVFAAGVSENDAETSCEPGILALYQGDDAAGYDFLLLQIVDDAGETYPTFASAEAAREYLGSEEWATIRGVLASFQSR